MSPAREPVWVVARDHWPRALLRGELIERGIDAIGFADAAHAVRALTRPLLPRPRLVVLDLSGAEEASARALAGQGVPVLLVGGAVEAARPWVTACPWAGLLRRPVSIDDVARAVLRLLAS